MLGKIVPERFDHIRLLSEFDNNAQPHHSRQSVNDAARPSASPTAAVSSAFPTTDPTTLARSAPSAMRFSPLFATVRPKKLDDHLRCAYICVKHIVRAG